MKSKQTFLVVGMATFVGLSSFMTNIHPIKVEASSSMPFNKDVVAQYNKVLPLVVKAQQTKKEKDVEIAYVQFVKMTEKFNAGDLEKYKEHNDVDKLYERLRTLMYNMPASFQKKHLPKMANLWVEESRKSLQSVMRYQLQDFLKKNPSSAVDKQFRQAERKLSFYLLVKDPDAKLPDNWDDSVDQMIKDQEKLNAKPVTGNPSVIPPSGTNSNSSSKNETAPPSQGAGTEFVQVGKTWYEVSFTYKDGKVIENGKKKLTPQSHPYLYVGLTDGITTGLTSGNVVVKNDLLGLTDSERQYLTEDQNETSNYTLQYSLDKQSEAPYYFDTGLRVDKDMNASYEQYKDVLYQIAVKSGGYVVEDKGRVLIVIDKKPVLVKDIKKDYSEKEIESLFEEFPNIDIRILETRIGTSTSLEQQIVTKQAKKVTVDGKEIELDASPIVRANRVLLPIKELTSALDAEVKQKEDQFIVTKDKSSVVYQLKNTKITVKGKVIDIEIAPDVKDGVLYVEMTELAKAFQYDLTWDADSSEIAFTKK